jgi:hypothetical protein
MGVIRDWLRRNELARWVAAGASALVLFAAAFFGLPELVVPGDLEPERERLALENNVRTAAAQAVAGLLILAGLGLTARSIAVTREGQLTERFSAAVEQLASPSLDVRVGGIYALHRLARNSREDHPAVIDVLLAYAARQYPWPPSKSLRRPVTAPRLTLRLSVGRSTIGESSTKRLKIACTSTVSIYGTWASAHWTYVQA